MAEDPTRRTSSGWNDDLDAQQKGYDSDYDPGADHYGGGDFLGSDPVALAKKWGSNPGGGTKQRKAKAAYEREADSS